MVNRHKGILTYIDQHSFASVQELCSLTGASAATIRRDLDLLQEEGHLLRKHGGAVLNSGESDPLSETFTDLALKGVEKVQNGEVLLLPASPLSREVGRHLVGKSHITVITNDLPLLMSLAENRGIHLVSLGGNYDPDTESLQGMIAEITLREIKADVLLFRPSGIDWNEEKVYADLKNTALLKMMMRTSRRIILLVDKEVFDRQSGALAGSLSAIDTVITDQQIPEKRPENLKIISTCQ